MQKRDCSPVSSAFVVEYTRFPEIFSTALIDACTVRLVWSMSISVSYVHAATIKSPSRIEVMLDTAFFAVEMYNRPSM